MWNVLGKDYDVEFKYMIRYNSPLLNKIFRKFYGMKVYNKFIYNSIARSIS